MSFYIFWAIASYSQSISKTEELDLRLSPVSYHLSFDNQAFFLDDFLEQSGKRSIEERKIDFPKGKFGKGIRMNFIPAPPDATNMSGIDLDLVVAVLFNTRPGNTMGYNQPFIWGSGRINPRLGAVAFWAKGDIAFAGPLFEQTTISFGRKERDLIGVLTDEENKINAYVRDARYVRHELKSNVVWKPTVWNHIVLNWDWANGMELWLNGEKIASSWGNDGWFETAPPGLFHLPAPGITYDELYLMDRPLSGREIKELISSNMPPKDESQNYIRKSYDSRRIAQYSGADKDKQLPIITPDNSIKFTEIWPTEAVDGNIPGWHIIDGRNEMAWPHEYAFFTIIPGDGDFHAEKVDIKTPLKSVVNYIGLTGNLKNVKVQAGSDDVKDKVDLFNVPDGEGFFYGSSITATKGSVFRIPFTENYGTPPDFKGDIYLPLSGEKRIQEVGLYHVSSYPKNNIQKGEKFILNTKKLNLDKRTQFAIHSLTSRDERKFAVAGKDKKSSRAVVDIGAFGRLNIMSEPFDETIGVTEITLSIPIKTLKSDEVLFVRVRDPAVPSRLWNQFAVKLSDFDKDFQKLSLTIDFHDLVVSNGDRLWVDLGTSGKTEILIGDKLNDAEFFISTVPNYLAIDAYAEKELIPAKAQYSKSYQNVPWLFTGKSVSIDNPYSYGGFFDMLLPALAVQRVKPDDFFSNYLMKYVNGPYFELRGSGGIKDGLDLGSKDTTQLNLKDPFGAPDWAIYMRDYNLKRWRIAKWWIDRQNPDGQIGGGWNDDTLFGNAGFEELMQDGNYEFLNFVNAIHTKFELTNIFKGGYCNIHPIDRLHTGDFISERYKTVIHNLGQAYATEREMESAWRLGKPEETPITYYAGAFKSSVNVLNWYWGKDIPDAPYIAQSLDSITKELRLFATVLDPYSFYRYTESRVMSDDFVPFGSRGENNIFTFMLGGPRGSRIDAHPRLAVGWPSGGGPEVARLVLRADDDSLDALVYSFDDKLRNLQMRLFRLNDGQYKIEIYEVADSGYPEIKDQPLWTAEKDLNRFDIVTLPIPSRKQLVIKVQQIKEYPRPSKLPDLAIDPWDAVWESGVVKTTIHNIGNAKAENVVIRLLDGEKVIEDKVLDYLNPPTDFVAKKAYISFNDVTFSRNLKIVIDPQNSIKEIIKENNNAFVVSADFNPSDPIMWKIYKGDFKGARKELIEQKGLTSKIK